MWLRQQVQDKVVNVEWISTAQMPADGMTKILPRQAQKNFLSLLNMQDAGHLIEPQS